MTDIRRRIIDIAVRNWWLVALAAIAGGVVAYLVAGSGPVRFEAVAPLAIDTTTIATQPRVPKPDVVIGIVQAPDFAETLELPADAVLRAYATGNPQDQLFVSVTASDRAAAEKAAEQAAEQAIDAIREEMAPALEDQRALVKANEDALAALGEPAEGDDLARFLRWDITKDNLNERSLLEYLENAYTFPGAVTVAQAASTRSSAVSAFGGVLAGLFVGLVLVAVREFAGRRAA